MNIMLGKNILLVDDDPAIYHTIQMVLEGSNHNLIYCDNIKSAIQYIKGGSKIDLIILDIMLPGQSGFEFLDVFRKKRLKAPVVVLSAIDSARAATEALKKGASDYVTKPFTLEDMKEVIHKYLKEKIRGSRNFREINNGSLIY